MSNKLKLQENNINLSQIKTTIENLPARIDWTDSTTITPTTSPQTIPPYVNKEITIEGDEDLLPSNIAKNVSIFGVTGTLEKPFKFTYTGQYELIDNPTDNCEWYIRCLTSGILNFASINTKIVDVFVIGGGGGGGGGKYEGSGGGGGGGYLTTQLDFKIEENTDNNIVIGAGGSGGIDGTAGGDGGQSSAFGIIANGGKGGKEGDRRGPSGDGGNGGSGGGCGEDIDGSYSSVGLGSGVSTEIYGTLYCGGGGGGSDATSSFGLGGVGGSNGSNGFTSTNKPANKNAGDGGDGGGGKGGNTSLQGDPTSGIPNTGGGGGGAYGGNSFSEVSDGANGGSGIVILRGRNS